VTGEGTRGDGEHSGASAAEIEKGARGDR